MEIKELLPIVNFIYLVVNDVLKPTKKTVLDIYNHSNFTLKSLLDNPSNIKVSE